MLFRSIFIDFNAQSLNKIETEAGKFFLKSILQLQLVTEPYHEELSADFEMALLRDAIKNLRIPFTGEPVKGLQIMGFLETRLLDFETLFILSVNEGFLPAQSARQSYIPYALRKAFGMQTSEHQDSISAYHFYRLLQRAGDVTLFYNAHAGKTGGGEPSRFIMQMDYELKSYSNIHIAHKNIQIPVVNYGAKDIVIEKKDDVAAALEKLKHNGEENGFAFSPTSVLTYLTCPLKFYLRYVARIKETESAEDKIEGALFGKILHRAMELLYSDLKTIDTATVTKLISEAEEKVIQSMHENFPQSAFGLEGKNILMKNILVDLAKRILKHDAAATPFTIEAVEFKAITEFKIDKSITVKIQGVIDRLESSKNYWRIVDYKTGKMEKLPEEGLMEKIFDGPKLKEAFQLYMYGWLLNRIDHTKTIQASFFELRKITSGMANLTENGFTESDYRMFEDHLKLKLLELFDSNTPFVQTDDANRCIYCPYTGICNR